MLCRLFHDELTHRLASGKENTVKLLVQEIIILFPAACDHRHIFGGENITQQFLQQFTRDRRVGTGFDDGSVARSQRIRQRVQRQQQRIVPGAHDQRHTVRHGLFVASGRKLSQRGRHRLFPGKTANVTQKIADLADNQTGLAHITFFCRFAEILFQRIRNGLLVVQQNLTQLF